ncbi:hypothetical protein Tco_0494940 [Tanacetum coccineum]
MACIEEITKDAEFNKIEDQLIVLIRRQLETKLMLEEKFRELCEEVFNFVKESKDVVQELERLSSNYVAKKTVRLLRRGQSMIGDNADLEFADGLSQPWDVLYIRVNELRMLSSELNVFGGPLAVQCAEFLKQLSQTDVLRMLLLRKKIAEVPMQMGIMIRLGSIFLVADSNGMNDFVKWRIILEYYLCHARKGGWEKGLQIQRFSHFSSSSYDFKGLLKFSMVSTSSASKSKASTSS